jgi:hypothetical protein
MSDEQQDSIIKANSLSSQQKMLVELFADLDSKQLDVLDNAGKSIIERIATFLTVLFAVTAFGSNFPPPYLRSNAYNKYFVIAILACYLSAMGAGMWALQPRQYKSYKNNLTEMNKEYERMVAHKKRWVEGAGILFALGSVALVALIIAIIWSM